MNEIEEGGEYRLWTLAGMGFSMLRNWFIARYREEVYCHDYVPFVG